MARGKKKKEEEGTELTELEKLRSEIKEREGDEAVQAASELPNLNRIPSGVFLFDYATLGGIPEGTATTLYGPTDSNKSWLALQLMAGYQRKYAHDESKMVCLGDFEKMHDTPWLEQNGVDPHRVDMLNPSSGQAGLDWILAYMDVEQCGLVILDSIPSVVPQAILEKSTEDQTMTELARLMSVFCSKAGVSWIRERKRGHYCTVILINQEREKPGVSFGSPIYEPGGKRVKYWPMTKVRVTCKKEAYDNGEDKHRMISFDITKNKGTALKRGVFRVACRNDDIVPRACVDDYKTVIDWARMDKFKLVTGGGQAFRVDGVDRKFGKLQDIKDWLMGDEEGQAKFIELKQLMIGSAREEFGLPFVPEDGYLLDWCEVG